MAKCMTEDHAHRRSASASGSRRAPTRTWNAATSADVAHYKTPDVFFSIRFTIEETEKPTDIDGYIARLQNYKKIVRTNLRRFEGRSSPIRIAIGQ
jgi:hypothetical protein